MSRTNLRQGILAATLLTALIHLVLGVTNLDFLGILFIFNALGYLALLVALLRPPAFLEGQRTLVYYAYIAFTAVTILGWLVLNHDFTNPLGVGTKIVELILIVLLVLHLRS